MTIILFIVLLAAALIAVEMANLAALAAAGVIVALILAASGAFFQGALQLVVVAAVVYLVRRLVMAKAAPEEIKEKEYISGGVTAMFIAIMLFVCFKLNKYLPAVATGIREHGFRGFDFLAGLVILAAALVAASMIIGRAPWRDE